MTKAANTKIAFIGFGEAGQKFAETLLGAGVTHMYAFDIKQVEGNADAIKAAAQRLNVQLATDPAAAVEGADWVISAVTASSCLDAATSVAKDVTPAQIYIDINSVSARTKQNAAEILARAKATYVDMAVMAPVQPRGHATPTLVAGALEAEFLAQLADLQFAFEHVGDNIGAATSIKLTRSLFVKGLEAITVQAMLAAKQSGCYDRVLTSLSKSFSGLGWPEFAAYELERVAHHGVRRGAEMHECALMMADNGFEEGAALADAIANLQNAVGALGYTPDQAAELDVQLDGMLAARKSKS